MTCEKTDTETSTNLSRQPAENGIEEPARCTKNACSVRERLAQQESNQRSREQQDALWKGWRDYPPVPVEVEACSWWWYRQRGEVDYTAPQVVHLLVDARVATGVCIWSDDGSVRPLTVEEYGDDAEFMPCVPWVRPDTDHEAAAKMLYASEQLGGTVHALRAALGKMTADRNAALVRALAAESQPKDAIDETVAELIAGLGLPGELVAIAEQQRFRCRCLEFGPGFCCDWCQAISKIVDHGPSIDTDRALRLSNVHRMLGGWLRAMSGKLRRVEVERAWQKIIDATFQLSDTPCLPPDGK